MNERLFILTGILFMAALIFNLLRDKNEERYGCIVEYLIYTIVIIGLVICCNGGAGDGG